MRASAEYCRHFTITLNKNTAPDHPIRRGLYGKLAIQRNDNEPNLQQIRLIATLPIVKPGCKLADERRPVAERDARTSQDEYPDLPALTFG